MTKTKGFALFWFPSLLRLRSMRTTSPGSRLHIVLTMILRDNLVVAHLAYREEITLIFSPRSHLLSHIIHFVIFGHILKSLSGTTCTPSKALSLRGMTWLVVNICDHTLEL
ncbi:hypothetical protein JB92DRAFT_2910783, partial [Gautieria morchelliformis]